MKPAFAILSALLVMASACSDRDDAAPTPSPGSSLTPPTTAATTVPTPAATPQGFLLVPSRALVIEVASGKVTTVYESLNQAASNARFDGNVIELSVSAGVQRFNLDGTSAAASSKPSTCTFPQGGVEIAGKKYPDVPRCGVFSPDGRWMTYQKPADEVTLPGGGRVPSWDQWVLDLETGTRRELQKGLVHCGGCDGRYEPGWSATSRFVAYAEYGGEARRFLSDVTTGETRIIGAGNDMGFAPQWAPTGNRIVYSATQARPAEARYEDLDIGRSAQLPIAWPVAFDGSGRYLFSPAWGEGPKATGQTTTVIDAATMAVVATLSGAPPSWLVSRPDDRSLAVGPRGVVAALQGATGCVGTSVTVGQASPACIDGGAGGLVNPNASLVTVAKAVGVTGPARGPGFETISLTRYDIQLFDVASGRTSTAVAGLLSWDNQAPLIIWNEAGTHLLVLAPSATGL